MTLPEISALLESIPAEIEKKFAELSGLRLQYLTAKAGHERDHARYLLETKTKNPDMTQAEIVATAVNLAFDKKMDAIKAESAYRKCVGELRTLRDRLEAVYEGSYNLRQEMKLR